MEKNDGTISLPVYLIDGAILAAAYFLRPMAEDRTPMKATVIFALLFLTMMFFLLPFKLLYLRYYFYGDILRVFAIFFLIIGLYQRGFRGSLVGGVMVAVGLAYADIRIISSNFTYYKSLLDPFGWMR